ATMVKSGTRKKTSERLNCLLSRMSASDAELDVANRQAFSGKLLPVNALWRRGREYFCASGGGRKPDVPLRINGWGCRTRQDASACRRRARRRRRRPKGSRAARMRHGLFVSRAGAWPCRPAAGPRVLVDILEFAQECAHCLQEPHRSTSIGHR